MRNPVIKRYNLKEDVHLKKKAGISALCEYSLLEDNDYNHKSVEDSLSVVLSLSDEEKQDERVVIPITKMLEEYVW